MWVVNKVVQEHYARQDQIHLLEFSSNDLDYENMAAVTFNKLYGTLEQL